MFYKLCGLFTTSVNNATRKYLFSSEKILKKHCFWGLNFDLKMPKKKKIFVSLPR